MRRLRAPLTVALAIAVLFDIREAFRAYQFGWPPNDFGYADELVQAALLWLAWKAWRAPKPLQAENLRQ
jgi:hypothetical protein